MNHHKRDRRLPSRLSESLRRSIVKSNWETRKIKDSENEKIIKYCMRFFSNFLLTIMTNSRIISSHNQG
jgi:hypothetical protein